MAGYANNVQDQNGDAIPGATVILLTYPAAVEAARTNTDAVGMYYFNVADGAYTIQVFRGTTKLTEIQNIQIGGSGGGGGATAPATWAPAFHGVNGDDYSSFFTINRASYSKVGKLVFCWLQGTVSAQIGDSGIRITPPSTVALAGSDQSLVGGGGMFGVLADGSFWTIGLCTSSAYLNFAGGVNGTDVIRANDFAFHFWYYEA